MMREITRFGRAAWHETKPRAKELQSFAVDHLDLNQGNHGKCPGPEAKEPKSRLPVANISGSAIVPTYQERNQRRGGGYILWLIVFVTFDAQEAQGSLTIL
ncbi:hypothetical protein CHU98_g7079 [Xylaria longipes]|nr:hypothetical protein CHU98_g7079 [Xylaria longipes]